MPVTSVTTDTDTLTLTITAEFAAPVERVWQIYADPRQLERIWGPPAYPATVVDHALVPGGSVTYFMTSPEGEKYGGWWEVITVDEPHSLTFDDGFADADLNKIESMPVSRNVYSFEPTEGGTRATYRTSYATAADLQQVLDMGMAEGSTEAIGQIDELLAG